MAMAQVRLSAVSFGMQNHLFFNLVLFLFVYLWQFYHVILSALS